MCISIHLCEVRFTQVMCASIYFFCSSVRFCAVQFIFVSFDLFLRRSINFFFFFAVLIFFDQF